VLLVSAPYALKAGDAETIGGLPPSAFVLAAPAIAGSAASGVTGGTVTPLAATDVTTTGGTADYLPMFSGAATIVDSAVFQSATSPFKIGINTITPATVLDVNGAATIRGTLALPAIGAATAAAGKDSQGLNLVASSFNSTSSTALSQTFRLQAEPAANDTTAPLGTLNLLYGLGATAPTETGFKISSKGVLTFATGQTFPGTGAGTITGITTAAGSGLAGGGVKGTLTLSVPAAGITNAMLAHPSLTVTPGTGLTGGGLVALGSTITLNVNTAKIPQLSTANTFVGNQTVTGTVTATSFTGGGAGLTNVTASNSAELGGLASSAYAKLAAANTFTGTQTVNGTVEVTSPASAIIGTSTSTILAAVTGAGPAVGVFGNASGASGSGVYGIATGASGTGVLGTSSGRSATSTQFAGSPGVWGDTGGRSESNFVGVVGTADDNSAGNFFNNSPQATLFVGNNSTANPTDLVLVAKGDVRGGICTIDVSGNLTCNGTLKGAGGSKTSPGGSFTGFSGPSGSGLTGTAGIEATGGSFDPEALGDGSAGVVGVGGAGVEGGGSGGLFTGGSEANGVLAYAGSNGGYAGTFEGDVNTTGSYLIGGLPQVQLDHPLDPANKYLFHSSVESSEMKNMYDGTITTDSQGQATVQLPEWFEVLNTDFRYQLTVIGQFAQAIVGHKIENNQFEIRTSAPNVEVSWQVTGVRQDAYAKAHPLVVEQEKDARLRGFYIHPEFYGAPEEKQIEWARHPQTMKKVKEMQARQLAAQKQAQLGAPRN